MATQRFATMVERQEALCRQVGIEETDGFAVIAETVDYLCLRHHKTWNEVTIRKSETQKRKEKEMKLW